MSFSTELEILNIHENNVSDLGFFCLMSRRSSQGYQRKLGWLKARFAEGMKIKMLKLPRRGFIEYIPGEYAWRPVRARGYMFIHCLWVVGKSKGKGYAGLLLDECLHDARRAGMHGVAMVTSEGNWLAGRKLLMKKGFESADQAPPSFQLMVKRFRDAPLPSFEGNWKEKANRCGKGLTIFRSDQCPYLEDATKHLLEAAAEKGVPTQVVELTDSSQVREKSPSAYGVFQVVCDGKPFSYHYLLRKDILQRLEREHT